jgi:hypothetical protein
MSHNNGSDASSLWQLPAELKGLVLSYLSSKELFMCVHGEDSFYFALYLHTSSMEIWRKAKTIKHTQVYFAHT